MKLISFDHSGFPAAAILGDTGDAVLPVGAETGGASTDVPVSMNDLLEDWGYWFGRLPRLARDAGVDEWVALDGLRVLAPVPRPRTVTCIGLNYRDHARETGAAIPAEPVVFAKHVASIVGSDDAIVLPAGFDEVDFEAELAIVIGTEVFRADPAEAVSAVAGFTVFNDVSARDWQARTSQWMVAKSFPTFGPMGPVLVTADEFGDARGHRIGLALNGEVVQDSSTDELIFGVGEIISYLSQVWPLSPGDVIATGTPAGVGFTRTPPIFLRDGDVVEVTIEGIGVLRNRVERSTR